MILRRETLKTNMFFKGNIAHILRRTDNGQHWSYIREINETEYFFFQGQHCSHIRENTLASMQYAIDHGADMVEFDVQVYSFFV